MYSAGSGLFHFTCAVELHACAWLPTHYSHLFYFWVVVFVQQFQYLIVSGFPSNDYLLYIFSFMYPLCIILYVFFLLSFITFVLDYRHLEYYAVRVWVLLKSCGQSWLELVNIRSKALLQSVGCGSADSSVFRCMLSYGVCSLYTPLETGHCFASQFSSLSICCASFYLFCT